MSAHFHTSAHPLKPYDNKVPENLVKGAICVDEGIFQWLPQHGAEICKTSTYITINKESDDVEDLIIRLAEELLRNIRNREKSFGLLCDETARFLCNENLSGLKQGFLLKLTASPATYAARISQALKERLNNQEKLLPLLETFLKLSQDPSFVREYVRTQDINEIYHILVNEMDNVESIISLLLQSLYTMMELNLRECPTWNSLPETVLVSLCSLVTGRTKIDDAEAVLFAEWSLVQLLSTSTNTALHDIIFAEVTFRSLIRHLARSDERVTLATLTLMNTMHKRANVQLKSSILIELETAPFRNAIVDSIFREGRARDQNLLEQLIPLQRLLLDKQIHLARLPTSKEDISQLEKVDWYARYAAPSLSGLLEKSDNGKLLFLAVVSATTELTLMLTENAMRDVKSRWDIYALCDTAMAIVVEVLSDDENVGKLIELVFSLEKPIQLLFIAVLQLLHKTWREMHAVTTETVKVANVVREQVRRVIARKPTKLERFQAECDLLSYSKMREIWKNEESQREVAELESDFAKELCQLLRPLSEQMVRQNRKNFLKQGYVFKKGSKKAPLKEQGQYFFWKLDANEKFLLVADCDSEKYVWNSNTAPHSRKIAIKDIKDVQFGDEGEKGVRKGDTYTRGIRLVMQGNDKKDEALIACAQNERDMRTWLDGICEILGKDKLSQETTNFVNRLVSTELRLRLLQVPTPLKEIEVPPMPSSFEWITGS